LSIKTLILGTFAAFAFVAGIQAASADIVRSGCGPPTVASEVFLGGPKVGPAVALIKDTKLGPAVAMIGPAILAPVARMIAKPGGIGGDHFALGDSGTSGIDGGSFFGHIDGGVLVIEGDNGLDIKKELGLTAST